MPIFQAESRNFVDLLQGIQDGDEICLKPGDYFGPFTIERAITIRGSGADSVIFATDEPALVVKVPGVRLENLAIERTVGGDIGEVVLSASPGTSPVLNQVRLRGIAENAQWRPASWEIPAVLDFTQVETIGQVKRSVLLEVGESCRVTCELGWLQVKPTYLSPGPQCLDVVLNSIGIPPGTKLSGSITLETPVANRAIAVSATIIASQVTTLPSVLKEPPEIEETPAQDWGYKFVGSAIDNFIRDIEGRAALQTDREFRDRRNHAEDLMFELVGEKPCLFYVRRKGQGQEPGEEKWDLTIATDIDDAELPTLLSERGKTLGLLAVVSQGGHGGLRLESARLLPLERGRADGFAVPFCLRLRSNYQYRNGVPRTAFARMATMLVPSDIVPTEDQLQAWEAFLNVEERLAQARQFCVPFVSHNYGEATRNITFVIDANLATVDGSSENCLEKDDFWQRVNRARNNDIKFLENTSTIVRGNRDGRELGTIESVEPVNGKIKVRLEAEILDSIAEGIYSLPKTGLLSFIAFGDIVQIDRKKRALKDLENGRSQNPYLARFLFDASQARIPQETVTLQPQDLLLRAANEGQKAAVETVLAVPDLALIQGPPGTGKTTVIAEICYQVALRGGRTLITSQANLAVDNALSRLKHNPLIRAVRKGNRSSVGPEGEPFLEDRVISSWLKNTSADCEKSVSQQLELVRIFRELLASTDRFASYLITEETFEYKQKQLQDRKAVLESHYQAKLNAKAIAETQQGKVESLSTDLDTLLIRAPSVNWYEPAVVNFLAGLQSYIDKDTTVQNLAANVRVAINLSTEFGLVIPELGVLGVAGWLQENVPVRVAELRKALTDASNTATAMAEAESNQQMFRQYSASLVSLQENHQKSSAIQQSQQQEVVNLQNSKSAIGLAIIEFDKWLSTAGNRVYVVLEKCLQEHKLFTQNLIKLPGNLQTAAPTNNHVSWQQHLDQCKVNINQVVQTYHDWDLANAIANKIYSLILPVLNRLTPTKYPNEKDVVQATEKLDIDGLGLIPALEKLHQVALLEVSILKKPLSFWDRIVEWILATAAQKNWCQPSRRSKAVVILEAISRQTLEIVQKSQPKDIKSVVELATRKLVEGLSEKISFWLAQEQAETEQRLQHLREQLNEQMMLVVDLQKQISATQELVETSRHKTEHKVGRVRELLQKLTALQQMPTELRTLAEYYFQNPIENLTQTSQLLQQVHYWEILISQLENLIPSLDPFAALSNIRLQIGVEITNLKEASQRATRELTESQNQLHEVNAQIQQQLDYLTTERAWWQEYWEAIPDRLKPVVPSTGLFNLNLLRSVETQFNAWKQELATAEAYLNRYQNLLSDWIAKLQNPSEQDRNELRRIYLDNANVIGITCSQSASKSFSEEFKYFDVVIIDEVSKCTPPELLIPALKGKKLVLVGDHRQLPPMLDSDTIGEIAEELGSTTEELSYLEESLFKSQFEVADESIKKMLTIQYRMHPSIMGAINQFYENKLECGLFDADRQRKHNLGNSTIKENHHLIWVKTPVEKGFTEQLDGTSFINIKEVEIITKLCEQMEKAWFPKIKQGEPRKEIGIITFYGRQLKLIEDRINPRLFPSLHLRTGTVDRFQGMERQIIIVSMVRNNDQQKVGFAKKPERVNVAFSRAQELLVIVGCHSLFTQQRGKVGSMYSNISNVVRLHGGFVNVSDIIC